MNEPWLHERRTWTGHWWLPGKSNEAQAGFLTYEPTTGLELTLVGGFEDRILRKEGPNTVAVLEGSRSWEMLHGLAENMQITLLDCFATRSTSFGFGFGGPQKQTVHAETALLGTHLNSAHDAVFTDATVVIEDLWRWQAGGVLAASIGMDEEGKKLTGATTLSVTPLETEEVEMDGLTVRLHHWITPPNLVSERQGSMGYARHTPVLSVTHSEAASLDKLEESVHALQDLIHLAVHRGASLLWMRLAMPPDESVRRPEGYPVLPRQVDVYRRRASVGVPTARSVQDRQVLFTLQDLPFEKVPCHAVPSGGAR